MAFWKAVDAETEIYNCYILEREGEGQTVQVKRNINRDGSVHFNSV